MWHKRSLAYSVPTHRLAVFGEVRFERKQFVTQRTAVALTGAVCLDVSAQVGAVCEPFAAHAAHIGPLARV